MENFQADFEGLREAIEKVTLADGGLTPAEDNVGGASGYEGSSTSSSNNYVFTANIGDLHVFFSVICAAKYTFVWIGTQTGVMNNLSLSMPTSYDQGTPLSTQIFGAADHSHSSALASKLAKKTNKPFYVSVNLNDSDPRSAEIDLRLFQELAAKPEKFF